MAVFFIFAMLLGASLQLTNAYGDKFLHDFANIAVFKDLTAVKYPAIIMYGMAFDFFNIQKLADYFHTSPKVEYIQNLVQENKIL